MKRILNLWLMAMLIGSLGFGLTSCRDDDENSERQKAEQQKAQAAKALKFYEVVSHLADLGKMNDESYESQTFEPVIGEASDNNSLTRIVPTNDPETAAMRFADITGLSLGGSFSASTPSYTYSDPAVGTLTYTKSTDGSSWAEVEVDIKQVPRLAKIIYKHPDQMGENASFNGTAYYRFGDVIRRNYTSEDGTQCSEYWICVRPAFGKEGKGDTHWISVGELPHDHIFHHPGSNNVDYYVPTKLCTDKENMQNFAEMLFAIFNPRLWKENLTKGGQTHPKMFWDFKVANIGYHNEYFWENVYKGWEAAQIAQKAFNMNSMAELRQVIDREGLNLLYKGYSWWTTFSWDCELYTASYTNGTGAESNLHRVKTETLEKNMKDIRFDCRRMGQDLVQYSSFFGDNTHRWTVRYATGKQLMARGTFNKFEGIVGCQNEWNYNQQYGPRENLSNTPPQETPEPPSRLETPVVGCIIAEDGNFYAKVVPNLRAVAKVVYVGAPGSVEKGMPYRGMAISQTFDETYGLWEASNSTNCQVTMTRQTGGFPDILDGIAATTTLANGCGSLDHKHITAEHCFKLDVIPEAKRREANLSNWFIPSVGQWILAFKGLGMTYNASYLNFTGMSLEQLNAKLNGDGYYFGFDNDFYYLTSTQFGTIGNATDMYSVFIADGVPTFFNIPKNKNEYDRRVRPFIAF